MKRVARLPKERLRGGATDRQALLANAPLTTATAPGGDIVVVKARVVVVHPADQPRGEMVVAEKLLIQALGGVVA